MKSILALALLAATAHAQTTTLEYQGNPFTEGAFIGQMITGTIVLDSPLYAGGGNAYLPMAVNFSVGGKTLTDLSYEDFSFTQNNGVLQDYGFKVQFGNTVIDGSGAIQDDGTMRGYDQLATYASVNCPHLTASAPACAQSSKNNVAGTWAQPAVVSLARVAAPAPAVFQAPEIDAGSGFTAVLMLGGILAVMTGKRPKP